MSKEKPVSISGSQTLKCNCSFGVLRTGDILSELRKLRNDTIYQSELLKTYKKQIDARDKEIVRLNHLVMSFKDCHTKDGTRSTHVRNGSGDKGSVKEMVLDIKSLQSEKIELEKKLAALLDHQNQTIDRILTLTDANKRLENQLQEMEKVALSSESEANILITSKEKEIEELRTALEAASHKITLLEKEKQNQRTFPPEIKRLQDALSKANADKRKLIKEINEIKSKENSCCQELERLKSQKRSELSRNNRKSIDVIKERDELREKLQKVTEDTEKERQALHFKIKTLEKDTVSVCDKQNNYIKEIERQKNRLEEYSKTLEQENSELRVSTTKISHLLNQAQDKRKEAELRVIDSQKIVESLRETLQNETQRKDHELSKLQSSLGIIETEKDKLTETNNNLLKELMSKNDELQRYSDSNMHLQRRVDELEHRMSIMNISSEEKITNIQTLSQKLNELNRKSSQLENENGNLSEQNSILQRQLNELTDKLTKSLLDQRNILNENVQLEKALNEKCSSISHTNKILVDKEKELENFKQKLAELERRSNIKDRHSEAYEKQIMALKNRIHVLESSHESLEEERNKEKELRELLNKERGSNWPQHINLNRVQGSIDLIRDASNKEMPVSNVDNQLSEAVERFLTQTASKVVQSSTDSVSSQEKVIGTHDYVRKGVPASHKSHVSSKNTGNYAQKVKRRVKHTNPDTTNMIKIPSKLESRGLQSNFMQERLIKDRNHNLSYSVHEGYPHQSNQLMRKQNHDHFHCCTFTHKIPSECDCICVCLPDDFHLCCTEVTEEFVFPIGRCQAGQTSQSGKVSSEYKKSNEKNPTSSSDTNFYMELLCESFESFNNSDYISFEKKLFDELQLERDKKPKKNDQIKDQEMQQKSHKIPNERVTNGTGTKKSSSQTMIYLPPPPPFPNTL